MPGIIEAPQTIDLVYDGKRHWFTVRRFTTPQELYTAMLKDDVRVINQELVSHTVKYPDGEECGRIYLLDTSIGTLAREATLMAFHIALRGGTAYPKGYAASVAMIAGQITSQLYSQSRYY